MKFGVVVLLAVLFSVSALLVGCGLFAGQVQDTSPSGEPYFWNERGEVTTKGINPETGEPRKPVMVYAEDGGLAAQGARIVKETLPSPWAEIGASALGLIGAGVSAWAIRQNRKARESRKYAEDTQAHASELITRIENNPKVKSAVVKNIGGQYSAGLEQLVQAVTRG